MGNDMYAVIRIRGIIGKNRKNEDTLKIIGLRKPHSMTILPEDKKSLMKKVSGYVAWGEISEDLLKKYSDKKVFHLNSPRKGFKAIKMVYPKGDLGYRGDKINELIERMSKQSP